VMVAILVEAAFGVGSDVLLTNSLLTVTLVPEGGLIEITQTNSSETFTIQTLLITEMAKTEAVNSISSFRSEIYDITTPAIATYQKSAVTQATMSVSIPMGSTAANSTSTTILSFVVSLFQSDGYVALGAHQLPVDSANVAISFSISGWSFESYDNTLDVEVSVDTPSAGGSYVAPELFLFNGASWTFSPTAVLPAPYDSSPVEITYSNSPTGVDLTIQFYASEEITYSTLWSQESTGASSRLTSFLAPFNLF